MRRIFIENGFIPPDITELLLASAFNFYVAHGGVFHELTVHLWSLPRSQTVT